MIWLADVKKTRVINQNQQTVITLIILVKILSKDEGLQPLIFFYLVFPPLPKVFTIEAPSMVPENMSIESNIVSLIS